MILKPSSFEVYDYEGQTFDKIHSDIFSITGQFQYLKFSYCIFNFEIYLDAEVSGKVEFIECEFLGRSRLNIIGGNYIEDFNTSFKNLKLLRVTGGQFKNLHIGYWGSGTNVEKIDFHKIHTMSGKITISKVNSQEIFFMGTNMDCEFDIFESFFKNITIFNFSNRNVFKLKFISPLLVGDDPSQFNIQESNLDNVELYNVDFKEFTEVNIRNSYISNTLFVGCSLPHNINAKVASNTKKPFNIDSLNLEISNAERELEAVNNGQNSKKEIEDRISKLKKERNEKNNTDNINQIGYRKENYKQLKYAFSKQGDKINERLYHGKEMEEYLKLDIPFFDILVISLSKWSSDFGQSILRPIVFNGVIHLSLSLFLFTFMGYNFSKYQISYTEYNLLTTKYLFNEALYLFMPLKGFVKDFLIIDILMKINSGLFLYNIIRASRKFYL